MRCSQKSNPGPSQVYCVQGNHPSPVLSLQPLLLFFGSRNKFYLEVQRKIDGQTDRTLALPLLQTCSPNLLSCSLNLPNVGLARVGFSGWACQNGCQSEKVGSSGWSLIPSLTSVPAGASLRGESRPLWAVEAPARVPITPVPASTKWVLNHFLLKSSAKVAQEITQ